LEVRAATANKFAEPPLRRFTLLPLGLASRPTSCFWRVKTDQANIRSAVIQADGIAVDDINGNGRSRGSGSARWSRSRRLFARNLGRDLNGSVANENADSD
jgi:hypothetical protein